MRYHPDPRFKTKHWSALWKNNARNLAELADADTSECIFVTVDTEGENEKGSEGACVTEIGLAVFLPLTKRQENEDKCEEQQDSTLPDYEADGIVKQNNAEVHCLGITGAQRPDNRWTRFLFGELQVVESGMVEATLVNLRESVSKCFGNPKIVLVGFCLRRELIFLSTHTPKLMELFSSWIGLQEIVFDLSGISSWTRGLTFVVVV